MADTQKKSIPPEWEGRTLKETAELTGETENNLLRMAIKGEFSLWFWCPPLDLPSNHINATHFPLRIYHGWAKIHPDSIAKFLHEEEIDPVYLNLYVKEGKDTMLVNMDYACGSFVADSSTFSRSSIRILPADLQRLTNPGLSKTVRPPALQETAHPKQTPETPSEETSPALPEIESKKLRLAIEGWEHLREIFLAANASNSSLDLDEELIEWLSSRGLAEKTKDYLKLIIRWPPPEQRPLLLVSKKLKEKNRCYTDPDDPCYPPELHVAWRAYRHAQDQHNLPGRRPNETPKQRIVKWLKDPENQEQHPCLWRDPQKKETPNNNALLRIQRIANWQTSGPAKHPAY